MSRKSLAKGLVRYLGSTNLDPDHLRLLLIALIALHVANPLVSRTELGGLLLSGLVATLFVSGVYAVFGNKLAFVIGLITGLPFFVVTMFESFGWHAIFDSGKGLAAGAASVPFTGYMAISMLHYVYDRAKTLDDRLVGAVVVYMLLGGAWSGIYAAMELHHPGSFIVVNDPDAVVDWALLQYYSTVTLTTLGYGDVLPATPTARSAASLEAIIGISFTVFVVARLVSTFTMQLAAGEKTEGSAGQ